jgi:hypothetical protein
MASKGKKSERSSAIKGLTNLTRRRRHPQDLWQSLLDATDSLVFETPNPNVSALAAAILANTHAQPIPDATFALVTSTALEHALELAVSTHFVLDDDECQTMFDDSSSGPLGTFAAKIRMAYALGVYPKPIKDELDLIRHIRNAFAHSSERIQFTSPEITEACAALRFPDLSSVQHLVPPQSSGDEGPKWRFLRSVRLLYVYLEWDSRASGVGGMRFETNPARAWFEGIGIPIPP